ncbi:hypothetical protein RhiJN_20211 [Ceratobasidium sp. AG-Ba]|nr:hypothetical protein RhiJN_20211 [Ceratobasidium sp. AG-Ba]
MSRYITALLTVLVTSYLAVTHMVPLYLLSPILFLSTLVVLGHTYVYVNEFIRHIVSIYDCYETVNFYDPGYKSYSDRYMCALCQIAMDLLLQKIQNLFEADRQTPAHDNLNGPPSANISSEWLQMRLERTTIYLIAVLCSLLFFAFRLAMHALCFFTALLTNKLLSLLGLVDLSSIMIHVTFVLTLAWILGLLPGRNTACIKHLVSSIKNNLGDSPGAKQRLGAWRPVIVELACFGYVVPYLSWLGTKALGAWLAGIVVSVCYKYNPLVISLSILLAYLVRRQLIKFATSITHQIWIHAFERRETSIPEYENTMKTEINKLLENRHRQVLAKTQASPYPFNTANKGAFRAPAPSLRSLVVINAELGPSNYISGHQTKSRLEFRDPEICEYGPLDAEAGTPAYQYQELNLIRPEVTQIVGTPAVRSASLCSIPFSDLPSTPSVPVTPSASFSPTTSVGSLPQLSLDISSDVATPTPFLETPPPMIDSLPLNHLERSSLYVERPTIRAHLKSRPRTALKNLGKVCATNGEDRAATWIHRSEWKQRTKLSKEKRRANSAKEINTPNDICPGTPASLIPIVESSPVVEMSLSPSTPIVVPRVERTETQISSISPTAAPARSRVETPASAQVQPTSIMSTKVPKMEATVDFMGARKVKKLPQRGKAARSSGTDAPPATNGEGLIQPTPIASEHVPAHSTLVIHTPSIRESDAWTSNVSPTPTLTLTQTLALSPATAPTPTSAPAIIPVPTQTIPRAQIQTPSPVALPVAASAFSSSTPKRVRNDSLERPTKQNKTRIVPADDRPAPAARPETLSRMLKSALYEPGLVKPVELSAAGLDVPKATAPPVAVNMRPALVYTLLELDGTKRVMQKGEVIPPRRQYTVKDAKGTRMLTTGSKPLKV